jgi:hypothetical protein
MICPTRTCEMLMTVPANVAAAITNEFLKTQPTASKLRHRYFVQYQWSQVTSELYYSFILPQVTQRFSL